MPIVNERQRQTYFGALNLHQECIVKADEKGNSKSMVKFMQHLVAQNPLSQVALLWDGASCHRFS